MVADRSLPESWQPEKQEPGGYLNVHFGPQTDSPVIGKAYPDKRYLLAEENRGWYKIFFSEKTSGWISAMYAEEES